MTIVKMLGKAFGAFILFTLMTGVLYTGVVTGIAQVVFPFQSNGSIVETDQGEKYCLLLGQDFQDEDHMWGRVMNYNVDTFTDEDGNEAAWAGATNISPASSEFDKLMQERIQKIRDAHPEHAGDPIPSDLVTCSGSGLDPHISPAAAEYQVERLAKNTNKTEEEVREIIEKCTEGEQFGILGEPTVNVVKVNLILDGKISA